MARAVSAPRVAAAAEPEAEAEAAAAVVPEPVAALLALGQAEPELEADARALARTALVAHVAVASVVEARSWFAVPADTVLAVCDAPVAAAVVRVVVAPSYE